SLAHYRRGKGLPGLTINWGEIKEVGYTARTAGVSETLARRGLEGIAVRHALGVLDRSLRAGSTQLGVMTVDWRRLVEFLAGLALTPRFSLLLSDAAPAAER